MKDIRVRLSIIVFSLSLIGFIAYVQINRYAAGLIDQSKLIEFGMEEDFMYCQKWRPEKFNINDKIIGYCYYDGLPKIPQLRKKLNDPLIVWAAKYNNKLIVDILLSRGSNIEAKDNEGMTALYHAVKNDHQEMAIFLIERGANLLIHDSKKKRSHSVSIYDGHCTLIKADE